MILDIILAALLFLAAVGGWRSGAFAMLASIVVLVAALLLAGEFATKVGTMLHLGPSWAWPLIGFVLIFVVIMILGGWVRGFFRPKRGLLRMIDGLIGLLLGFVRGALILGILLALLQLVHLPPEHFAVHSHIYPLLITVVSHFVHVLRPYLHVPGAHAPTIAV